MILLAFLLFAVVCADENVNLSENSTEITFEGVKFTIPQGFAESKNSEDFNDLGSEGQTCFYINDENEEIVITVISDWMGMNTDELHKDGAKKFIIKGHEGWSYKEGKLHYFGYVSDDKGILIGSTNRTLLKEVIA